MSQVTLGPNFDFGDYDIGALKAGAVTLVSSNLVRITRSDGFVDELSGSGFQSSGGQITAGQITGYLQTIGGATTFAATGLAISAPAFFSWVNGSDIAAFQGAVFGGNDTITGSVGFEGAPGGPGDDLFIGNGGLDVFDGGAGLDTAGYASPRANYKVVPQGDNFFVVRDLRTPSGDGTDYLNGVERVQFSDASLDLSKVDAVTRDAYATVLRLPSTEGVNLGLDVGNGLLSSAAAIQVMVREAGASTSVATLAYQFFTDRTPSPAGMDYLLAPNGPNPNNLNSAYYQSFNLENRYINFAVNLGKGGEGRAGFESEYGALNLFEATRKAYAEIFGDAPSDTKLHALLDPTTQIGGTTLTRADYFAYYGQDGANGIGTKAAMVGWLLAEAVKADVGVYAKSNDAFLTDVAEHDASFGLNLVGVYSQPGYVYHPG